MPTARSIGTATPPRGAWPSAELPQRHDLYAEVLRLLRPPSREALASLVTITRLVRSHGSERDRVALLAKAEQLRRHRHLRSPWHAWYRWAVDQLPAIVPPRALPAYMRRQVRAPAHRWHELSGEDRDRYELGRLPPTSPDQGAPAPSSTPPTTSRDPARLEAAIAQLSPDDRQLLERFAARNPAAARARLEQLHPPAPQGGAP